METIAFGEKSQLKNWPKTQAYAFDQFVFTIRKIECGENGVMECWSIGEAQFYFSSNTPTLQHSNTPSLHHSN